MTTGRINQVTTFFKASTNTVKCFPNPEFVQVFVGYKPHLGIDLTYFKHVSLCFKKKTRITVFDEDYQQPAASKRCTKSRRIFK
jgi:hypothetical protein